MFGLLSTYCLSIKYQENRLTCILSFAYGGNPLNSWKTLPGFTDFPCSAGIEVK
jgi:hypothetical protein